jgi:hypothetical protein
MAENSKSWLEAKNCVIIESFAAHKAAFEREQMQAAKRFLRRS